MNRSAPVRVIIKARTGRHTAAAAGPIRGYYRKIDGEIRNVNSVNPMAREPETIVRMITRTSVLVSWLAVIGLVAWAWRTPPGDARPDLAALGVTVSEQRVYRTVQSQSLALDVYSPLPAPGSSDSRVPRPAVLMIHGGSWIGGSKSQYRDDPRTLAIRLAGRGLVVFAVDYRLAAPARPSWPDALDDLREAVRWIRRRASEFAIDPDRIAVIGQSSGAHLAMLLGTLPDDSGASGVSSRVQAVVSLYGPTDLPELIAARHLKNEPAALFLGAKMAPWPVPRSRLRR